MAAPKETHPESSSDEEVESGSSSDESVEEEEVEAGGQGQKEESDEEKEEESESDEEKEEESESDEEKEEDSESDEEEEDSESDEEKDEDSQKKTVPSKPASSSAPVIPVSSKPASSSAPVIHVPSKPAPVIHVSSKPASSSSPATAAEGEDGLKKENDPFARVWSEEEETVILEELLKRKERGDTIKDVPGVLDSIKGKLHFAATVLQMKNKIKRLKQKFRNNFKRGKGGLDPKFSKAHDLECYGFMKVIWKGQEVSSRKRSAPAADDNGNANGGKKKRRKRVSEPSSYPFLTFAIQDRRNSPAGGEMLWKECLPLLGGPTVEEMERKWREFHRKEVQLNLERLDLLEGPTVEEMERKFHRKEVQLNLERLDLAREMTSAFLNASPT